MMMVCVCVDELAMMQQRMLEIQQLLASQAATTTVTASPQPVSRSADSQAKLQRSKIKGTVLGLEGKAR